MTPSSNGLGSDITNVGMEVQVLPESLGLRSGISLDSKSEQQGSIPWRPACVVLASRTANAGRQPKINWVKVPGTTPFAAPRGLDDGFISRAGCGSSPPAATKIHRGVAQE